MRDALGREIRYARLSVTDACNLNCVYCGDAGTKAACTGSERMDARSCADQSPLSAGDFELIARALVSLGVDKLRITGGEPLTRPDLEDLIARLSNIDGVKDLPMTTNGVGLAPRLAALRRAGMTRLNISLDTLNRERYAKLTGVDALNDVLTGIREAANMGFRVKVNAVLIKGENDGEAGGLIELTRELPISMRFIELMPIGSFGEENADKIVTSGDLLARFPALVPKGRDSGGVCSVYRQEGYMGSVGFISPMSHRFCADCNRVRITADGKLRLCLGVNDELDLKPYLAEGIQALAGALREAIYHKPRGHSFERAFRSNRDMSAIGG